MAIGLLAAVLIGLIVVDTYPFGRAVSLPAQSMQAPSAAVSGAPAPAQMVGVFTGTYENGLPVYRLPAVQVSAVRERQ